MLIDVVKCVIIDHVLTLSAVYDTELRIDTWVRSEKILGYIGGRTEPVTRIFQVLKNMLVLPTAREGAFEAYEWSWHC